MNIIFNSERVIENYVLPINDSIPEIIKFRDALLKPKQSNRY